jgi:deazaflavin-dependent oxidoreductase (nitroreductase family)
MSPLPKTLGRMNNVGLNRLTSRIFTWLPGCGVVVHRGRKSGRTYRTPMWVFRTSHGYVLALGYGPDTDWVRNVLAADGAELQMQPQTIAVSAPRLFRDETRADVRVVERLLLRLVRAADFLEPEPAERT